MGEVNLRAPVGFNPALSHATPSAAPQVSVQLQESATKVNQSSSSVINNPPASQSSRVNSVVKTPQNTESGDWFKTLKRVAVIALPIIAVVAFVGIAVGLSFAPGGALLLPLVAGALYLGFMGTAALINHFDDELWHDNAQPRLSQSQKKPDSDQTNAPRSVNVREAREHTPLEEVVNPEVLVEQDPESDQGIPVGGHGHPVNPELDAEIPFFDFEEEAEEVDDQPLQPSIEIEENRNSSPLSEDVPLENNPESAMHIGQHRTSGIRLNDERSANEPRMYPNDEMTGNKTDYELLRDSENSTLKESKNDVKEPKGKSFIDKLFEKFSPAKDDHDLL